jgi:glycosyltransferase involved in cell wall biosynthesis
MAHWSGDADTDYEYGTLLRDSHALICLSDMHRSRLADVHTPVLEKARLIPPPPLMNVCPADNESRTHVRSALGVDSVDFLLVFYGYIYGGKGLETLLEALHRLQQNGRNVRLLIVGGPLRAAGEAGATDDYLRGLQELGVRLGIADRIIWCGPVAGNDGVASAYLRAADACILPFDRGIQLNNSSFAAAAVHGLPIITTSSETTEAHFRDHDNVLLCPPRSPDALAGAVEALMDEPQLIRQLVAGVQSLADECFSWEKATRSTVETLVFST